MPHKSGTIIEQSRGRRRKQSEAILATTDSDQVAAPVKHEFLLSVDHLARLQNLAERRQISESQIIERALDVFLSLADVFSDNLDRQAWYQLSQQSLMRLWDNDADAVYDQWRELYDVPEK